MRLKSFVVLALAVLPALSFAQGKIRGEIQTKERLPVPGATVIMARSEAGATLGLTTSDGRGLIGLDAVPSGTYDIHVEAAGFTRGLLDGVPVQGPYRAVADLQLEEGLASPLAIELAGEPAAQPRARARIVDADGKALAGVRVRFEPLDQRANPVERRTGASGEVQIDGLVAGAWRLTLTRAGWARIRVARLTWTGGELLVLARMLPLPEDTPVPLDELLPEPGYTEAPAPAEKTAKGS